MNGILMAELSNGTETRRHLAQLSFRGPAATAHYPFMRTFGCYEVCGAELVAFFAPVGEGEGDDDDAAEAMATENAGDLPPATYTVGKDATVQTLQFVLSSTASVATESQEGQSVAASLGADMPHVSALAKTVSLAESALSVIAAIQKRAIAAGGDALLGTSQLISVICTI